MIYGISWRMMSAVCAAFFVSCAQQPLPKIEADHLPGEIPAELQEKFEIREELPAHDVAVPLGKENKRERAKTPTPKVPKKSVAGVVIPERFREPFPFKAGEKLIYEISYFGVVAGNLELSVLPNKIVNGRSVMHLHARATTSKLFGMFYSLEDTVESYWDAIGLFSHRFHLLLNESRQTRDALELNDWEKGQTFYWNRWKHYKKGYTETKETNAVPSFAQDSLSALYYVRTLPLVVGSDPITFPIISEGKYWEAVVKVVRQERLKTKLGDFETVVINPDTKFRGILQKKAESFIWLTNDERRLMVRVEAHIKIGSVIAVLREFRN